MIALTSLGHLTRRFCGSLSRLPPPPADAAWAVQHLLPREAELWLRMPVQDRRHSLEVARRFALLAGTDDRADIAGALLHDVGKTVSGLGTFGRVVATIAGPRTKRSRLYHDHEAIGVELLRAAGSEPGTVALVAGTSPATAQLRAADNV